MTAKITKADREKAEPFAVDCYAESLAKRIEIIAQALADQREEQVRMLDKIRFQFESEGNKVEPHFIAMLEAAIRKGKP